MDQYNPPYQPDLTVYYTVSDGQEWSFDQPGYEPEIEFTDIEINGLCVGIELFGVLVEIFWLQWEREILRKIRARRVA